MSEKIWTEKAGEHTLGQLLYVRYFVAILVDLVVLNLFEEYWDAVVIESFTISLLTALMLQALLKITIKIEHRINLYFKAKGNASMRVVGGIVMYLVLLAAKLLILEVVNWAFGDRVQFNGPWHGVVAFLTVVIVMLTIEGVVVRVYFSLEKKHAAQSV